MVWRRRYAGTSTRSVWISARRVRQFAPIVSSRRENGNEFDQAIILVVSALLATVFLVADIFSDSWYSIYFLLFFPFNNNHDVRILLVMVNFILCYTCLLCTVCCCLGRWRRCIQCVQSIVCLRLCSWTHLCVSYMLDAWMTTDSYIRAVTCRCAAC